MENREPCPECSSWPSINAVPARTEGRHEAHDHSSYGWSKRTREHAQATGFGVPRPPRRRDVPGDGGAAVQICWNSFMALGVHGTVELSSRPRHGPAVGLRSSQKASFQMGLRDVGEGQRHAAPRLATRNRFICRDLLARSQPGAARCAHRLRAPVPIGNGLSTAEPGRTSRRHVSRASERHSSRSVRGVAADPAT